MRMSSGALEPHFFAALLKGLSIEPSDLPGTQSDRQHWPAMADTFSRKFAGKTRRQWERIFDGTDACVTPVLTQAELERAGYDQRPLVLLSETPGLEINSTRDNARATRERQDNIIRDAGWAAIGLAPGEGGEQTIETWMRWRRGKEYDIERGGLVLRQHAATVKASL